MSEFKSKQKARKEKSALEVGKCKLCGAILRLEKSKIVDFYEAMIDKSIQNITIVEVLGNWDISTSISTISSHRNAFRGDPRHLLAIKKAAES